jgi:uncharacterized protein YdeI (YjbR/CyaY-like superfamily)
MKNTDPRVDEYIEKAKPFAQPILNRIRKAFHDASPELREEIKWGVPHFTRNGIIAGMAAFKEHVGFGFWRSKEMKDPLDLFQGEAKASTFYMKMKSVRDVPTKKIIKEYVAEAIELDESFVDEKAKKKRASKKKVSGKKLSQASKPPADLLAAMKKNKKALTTFAAFPPSKKRDYVEWITEAKREATREKRLKQAIEWMAEGKARHWKYGNC